MRNLSNPRRWLAAVAGGLIATCGFCAQPSAGPWSRAVALPTACYSSQDQFAAKNNAALEAVTADASRQSSINQEISSTASADMNTDPMAAAARVQEQLAKDPANAMKYMQQMGATDPAAVQAGAMHRNDQEAQMQSEEKDLLKRYEAAVQAALAPARAHFAALRKKLGITEGWGVGESGTPGWAFAEYDQIKREADQAYAAMCPQWWGATGAVPTFMKRFREYLVNDRIPHDEKGDSARLAALAMQGKSTESYKSTVTVDAVRDYMKLGDRLYRNRPSEPRCAASSCRDISGI